MKIGSVGVEIFFVISGFLIGGILLKSIDEKKGTINTLKNFWIRRWMRTLPLYYTVLLFKYIVIDNSIGWKLIYYIFFLQNNLHHGPSFLGVSWSLVLEEWFYLFCPIYLLFLNHFFKKSNQIIFFIALFITSIVILRTRWVLIENVSFGNVNAYFPYRFDSMFIGVLLSYLNINKPLFFSILKSKKVFIIGLLLFIAYLFFYWNLAVNNLINKTYIPRTIGFFILPFSIGLTLPYISTLKINFHQNNFNKIIFYYITWTSLLTYSIYLIHPFIYSYFIDDKKITNIFLLNFTAAIIITYITSYLIFKNFENPILKLRDKISS